MAGGTARWLPFAPPKPTSTPSCGRYRAPRRQLESCSTCWTSASRRVARSGTASRSGANAEYTWYIRDGFFVRSPVKFNVVEIGEGERRKYEAEFLRRSEERRPAVGRRQSRRLPTRHLVSRQPADVARQCPGSGRTAAPGARAAVRLVGLFPPLQVRGGHLRAGRPRDRYGQLRVEYYPSNLFSDRQRRRMARDHDPRDPKDAEIQRMMNKVALVTMWIEPDAHQIVKYTFDNIDFDFLPAQWLVRLGNVRATMTMGQPFPGRVAAARSRGSRRRSDRNRAIRRPLGRRVPRLPPGRRDVEVPRRPRAVSCRGLATGPQMTLRPGDKSHVRRTISRPAVGAPLTVGRAVTCGPRSRSVVGSRKP